MLGIDDINKLEAENQKLKNDLHAAVTQYNAVVNQNKDLQKELGQYKKALERVREDISGFCVECQDECKECTVYEVKTQINEVIPA